MKPENPNIKCEECERLRKRLMDVEEAYSFLQHEYHKTLLKLGILRRVVNKKFSCN